MNKAGISRRDVLRTLAISTAGGSVLQVIPAAAAEYVHQTVHQEKTATGGRFAAKYFNAHEYATLRSLCDAIIPKDEKSGGALEAGAPEFIDLLTSENVKYQMSLRGGLAWLDNFCNDRFSTSYLDSKPDEKQEVLNLIAFRKNATKDHTLSQGVVFFSLVRSLTCDAFYTSKIGIADLQYMGNTSLREFPGCPPIPEA
ncbi:MAG: gluconate 2-dehydrogenase subunit 3 family protein [Candidatus Acidiferrum sp.]